MASGGRDDPRDGHSSYLDRGDASTQFREDSGWNSGLADAESAGKSAAVNGRRGAHRLIGTPTDQSGALTLFQAPPLEHLSLAKHLTAERRTEEFVAGKGVVTKWERVRRANHWFDTLYNACAAGHWCGVRLIAPDKPRPRVRFSEMQQEKRYGKLSSWADRK